MSLNLDDFIEQNFTNIQLNIDTIGVYTVRKALLNSIEKNLQVLSGDILDVGCGVMPYKKIILKSNPKVKTYLGLDLETSMYHNTKIADYYWDGENIPFEDASPDLSL